MPQAAAIKYRAFLSYSHDDSGWAKWLHARLENFRFDRDLIGRETPVGPVPDGLRPIFRDRNDFSAGDSLVDATIAALDASAALIVLCSPVAATRAAVNEEVRIYRARHPDRPAIPVIIGGTWPGNFPSALRFELDADGCVSDRPVTILGPDLREDADGKSLGLAKLVAGLTGLAPDDLYRRAERARRRQNRRRGMAGAAIVTLVLGGGLVAWHARQADGELADARATAAGYLSVDSTDASGPRGFETLAQGIQELARNGPIDPRREQIRALVKAGRRREATALAETMERDGEAQKQKQTAADERLVGALAGVTDPDAAREAYAKAAQLDPSDISGMLQNGWFQQQAGELDAASDAYAHVMDMTSSGQDDEALMWAKLGTGDIQNELGKLSIALAAYRDAEAIADRLAKSDPSKADWQRDLSVAYERIGDLQVAGDLAGALKSYRDSLDIRTGLAQSDRGQHDLSVAYEKVGDVQQLQGNLAGALASYHDSFAIRDRLTKSSPDNVSWRHDLSVADNKIGDVLKKQDDLPGALASYRAGLAIQQDLTKSDPGNAEWQCDLSGLYDRVGDVLMAQGDLADALQSYQASLTIIQRQANSDPFDAVWQRDLSVAYDRIGNVQGKQGDLAGAEQSDRDGLAIRVRLANSDPGNAEWQRDLANAYDGVGDLQDKQGDYAGAEKSHRDSLAIRDQLVESDPANVEWKYDLANSYDWIGDLLDKQGNLAGALESYRAGLTIRQALVAADSGNVEWRRQLQFSIGRIGDLAFRFILQRDFANALKSVDQAIPLAPDEVWLYANRAHALMFLGRDDEARALYLRYRSEMNVLNKRWDTLILDDFDELRKAGLINPLMDEISKLLAS